MLGHRTIELAPEARNTVFGLLTFAGLVVAVLWQPIIGAVSDRTRSRWGRRLPFFLVGGLAAIAALFLIALAGSVSSLLALLLLLQVSTNTIQSPSQALIPDHVPSGQRGAAAGWKAALEIVAFVVGRQTSGRLVAAGEVLAAVGVAAAAVLAAVAVIGLTTRGTTSASPPLPRPTLRSTFGIDRRAHPAFGPWFVNRVMVWGGFIALNTFLLFFVIDVLGMAEARAQRFVGDLSALMGIGLLLVALPAGSLSDRLGRRRLVAAAGATASAGTVLLLAVPSTTTALIAGGILALSVGVFLTTSWALATHIVPRSEPARMLGLANIATAVGSALARLSGGLLIDPVNRISGGVGGYYLLYGIAGLAFLVGTAAILRMPDDAPG